MSQDSTDGAAATEPAAATHAPDQSTLTGICSMAMRSVLAELLDLYRQQSGERVSLTAMGGVDAVRCIDEGTAFDFAVLASDAIEALGCRGRVDPASRTDLARSGVAIAVRAGAPRPEVINESTLRELMQHSKSIGYSTGPSGAHLMLLLERWSIRELVAARLVQAPPGVPVGALLARGDVDIGFQQLSELLNIPGIDVLGALPASIQANTIFSGALCSTSTNRESTRALLAWLASSNGDAAKHRFGMAPARAGTA
jgi:molybdate transport system substrate-binding protein